MAAMDADDMRSILHEIGTIRDDVRDELGKMHVKINSALTEVAVIKTKQDKKELDCAKAHQYDGSLMRSIVEKGSWLLLLGAVLTAVKMGLLR